MGRLRAQSVSVRVTGLAMEAQADQGKKCPGCLRAGAPGFEGLCIREFGAGSAEPSRAFQAPHPKEAGGSRRESVLRGCSSAFEPAVPWRRWGRQREFRLPSNREAT